MFRRLYNSMIDRTQMVALEAEAEVLYSILNQGIFPEGSEEHLVASTVLVYLNGRIKSLGRSL